ncbi:MFS transporter [Paenibacillus sp. NPDC058071]|uniref:MFS transporter n=1 Tax=Paenibacillus sp. NPDC058071 TaxID=3346326 RepID=UPI0036D77CF0
MLESVRSKLVWKGRATIPPDRKLSRDAIVSIAIHGFFQFGASMSGLFLNLYLWRLTESLAINGYYNLILYAVTPMTFAVGGWIAKKRDKMLTYRIGIGAIAIFYLLVVIAKEQVAHYYIPFAIMNGIASGLYWTGYIILQYDVSTDRNRSRYLAINMVVFNTAGLIGPALAGFIIQQREGLQGYIIIFMLAFVMFLIAAIISLRIPSMRSHHTAYYLHYMGLLMKKKPLWLKALFAFLVLGLFQGMMLFLPNIMLYQTVGREDWVGYLGVFFSALTVATGYVISRSSGTERVRRQVLLSTTGVAIGAGLLLIEVHFWSVALFMIVFSICNPLILNTLNSYYYGLIGTLPLKGQLRVEGVVMRELFLNIGRVISIAMVIWLAKDTESAWLAIVLFAAALMQYGLVLFVNKRNEV